MDGGYTADDLVTAATRAGFPGLTSRAITDWVQRGLLDRPIRQSKGRGQGSAKATYPEAQRDLLLLLLEKRRATAGVAHLLVVPIAIWLYWGEEYVPTRQALRALMTWAKHYETSPAVRARDGVAGLLAQIAHPEASETSRRGLQRTLTQASTSQAAIPRDLSKRISAVVDPHGQGRTLGLPGIPLDPETLVGSWLKQRQAIRQLRDRKVGNSDLERARSELRQALTEYAVIQPWIAVGEPTDPYGRIQASPLGFDVLVQNAARDLLLPLAAVLHRGDA